MINEIRLPAIGDGPVTSQIAQIRSYLYQFAEQLNIALKEVDKSGTAVNAYRSAQTPGAGAETIIDTDKAKVEEFNRIKSLIIKSADIVNAYSDTIERVLVGKYTALSEFGNFKSETQGSLEQTSTHITQLYTATQTLETELGEFVTNTQSYIKTGLLEEGETPDADIYGVEVGQKAEVAGEVVFKAYARFTANRLSFYDEDKHEVAYISDRVLHITRAEITNELAVGGYLLQKRPNNGIVWVWRGES